MRGSLLAIGVLVAGCTAPVHVVSNPSSARIYLTDGPYYGSTPPVSYLAMAEGELRTTVEYFAWSDYYVWGHAPGYQSVATPLPTEPKVGPIIGGCFLLFPWIWAIGPTSGTVHLELRKVDGDGAPVAPAGGGQSEKL